MDFDERMRVWITSLTADQRQQASAVVGREIPHWMVVSLRMAGFPVVPAELGVKPSHWGYLLPTIITDALAEFDRQADVHEPLAGQ